MAMTINTNLSAMTAQRYLGINNDKSASSLAKLSSGSRIPSAKYDAAGLAIGTKLNAEISSLKQASQNAAQAVSMLQIADGALATTADILTRMKSLAVQASSGQLADSERTLLNQEFVALRSEVDRIASDTAFNGTSLLDGGQVDVDLSYGAPGRLAINGISNVEVDANYTSDNDVFRISYDHVGATNGNATDETEQGNLTVTNLTTGESQTIDIRAAIQAVTGESTIDTTGEGASGDVEFATNLGAGQTADIEFASLGVTLTLDNTFDVDGTGMATDVSPLSSVYSGGTAVAAALRSAVSNVSVPNGSSGANSLSTTGVAELATLGSTVYDGTTGNLYIDLTIDGDNTTEDTYAVNATAGLEFSLDGSTWSAGGAGAFSGGLGVNTARTVHVRLATSQEEIMQFDVASLNATSALAADAANVTLGFKIADGLVGVDETAGSTKSFSYKVGTGTASTDSISITLGAATTSALSIGSNTITSASNADTAITALDSAITTVSTRRADIGASQSRLDFAAASVAVTLENTTAANSAIMDADVSQEMTEFTSKQVLLQAGISMLSQANQQPALLLSLLQ